MKAVLSLLLRPAPAESFEAYRAAKVVARLTTLSAIVLAFVCLSLVFLLMTLFPLKEVQPMLVTLKDKTEQVVHIEPLARTTAGLEKLTEALCRQYVIARETFDLQTEALRWHQVGLMSSPELQQDFLALMDPKKEGSPYQERLRDKATRSVRILSSTSLAPAAPDVFQVEWVAEDRHQGRLVGQGTWLTTLTVSLQERTFNPEDAFINPLGVTVTHYTVARKKALPAAEMPAAGVPPAGMLAASSPLAPPLTLEIAHDPFSFLLCALSSFNSAGNGRLDCRSTSSGAHPAAHGKPRY